MFRLPFFRNLHSVLWLLGIFCVPILIGIVFVANEMGLPEPWRSKVEQEISKRGTHVKIASLSYTPFRGFFAKEVRVYADKERDQEISRFESINIVPDYSLLARGEVSLRKLVLKNAKVSLSLDADDPEGESITIERLNGTMLVGKKYLQIHHAKGLCEGLVVDISAKLKGFANEQNSHQEDDGSKGKRREQLAILLKELRKWNFGKKAPEIYLNLRGNMDDLEELEADFTVKASRIGKRKYLLNDVLIQGSLNGYMVEFSHFSAKERSDSITGYLEYKIDEKKGRFYVDSAINLMDLCEAWFALPMKIDAKIDGKKRIQMNGSVDLENRKEPKIQITGNATLEQVDFRGVDYDVFQTSFSCEKNKLYLPDFEVKNKEGFLRGKFLLDHPKVRLSLHTSLPARYFEPYFINQPLGKILKQFTFDKKSRSDVRLDGFFDLKNRFAWEFKGTCSAENISYQGVPCFSAKTVMDLSHKNLNFYENEVSFDYRDYSLSKTFSGESKGYAHCKAIQYSNTSKTVTIEKANGKIWAAPLLRMFAKKTADHLEQYRFHAPSEFSFSGIIDVTAAGRSDFQVKFSSQDKVDYTLFDKNITLGAPEGLVTYQKQVLDVSITRANLYGGNFLGNFRFDQKSELKGNIDLQDVPFHRLLSKDPLEESKKGLITGDLAFSMNHSLVSSMAGVGKLELKETEIFSIPLFGPLSKLVSLVVNQEKFGYERATSAFCNFKIQKGIFQTEDFLSKSDSLVMTGEGSVDLDNMETDMTVRLNARGLFGLLTLPLRPLYGLFQFRGTGKINDTEWKNVHFTRPSKIQKNLLLDEKEIRETEEIIE